ncbi:hypothetical protein, partial [Eudoraea sp.]|uniref:hypothetical protein n=1 Tax=Eudoraea sp. TaxID=1979955 RepID=UPI003C749AA3
VLSDGEANDKENFDVEILKLISDKKKDCTIHFIGISQNDAALKKSNNLSEKTGGIYTNLKAMDYDKHTLNVLLSKLNTTIAGNALKVTIMNGKPLSDLE